MKPGMKCFLAIIGLIVFLGFVAINVQAPPPHDQPRVWVDDDADPGWYDAAHVRTIQEAVDNVSSGGTVHIWEGDYIIVGGVNIEIRMSIIGNTTVDAVNGMHQDRTRITYDTTGFRIYADEVNISGLSLTCTGADLSGIHVYNAEYCNISNNFISQDLNDGIYLENSCNNTIVNNIVINCSYGIQVFGNSTANIIAYNNISYGLVDGGSKTETYYISVKQETGWTIQQELHFSQYYTREIAALPLPDIDGDYKIRITQQGGTAAHIDYVALLDDLEVVPVSAVCLDDGTSVLQKVIHRDNDVADVHEKTIEVTWDEAAVGSMLILEANEEQPIKERAICTPHSMLPQNMEEYMLQNNGGMAVDGIPDELCDTGDADFNSYWMPSTGHPWGTTYLWLRSDGAYLYALMEVISDNTYDETGWGSLYVFTGGELKEFRITSSDDTYGLPGFVYTDKVGWQHMVYEFHIPLAEIGTATGDSIKLGYGSYGTSAEITAAGIYLRGRDNPDWNVMTNNTIYGYNGNNMAGIKIGLGNYNEISHNTIFDNRYGIFLQESDENAIIYNTIHDNDEGIFLVGSAYNTITDNIIEHNTNRLTGLNIIAGKDNEIHRNCFIDNIAQAADSGTNNDWDGNYWSDYTGTPPYYQIPAGSTDARDNDPLDYCGQPWPRTDEPCGVGGEVLPVGTFELLAPYIAAGLVVAVLLGLAMVGFRRRNT